MTYQLISATCWTPQQLFYLKYDHIRTHAYLADRCDKFDLYKTSWYQFIQLNKSHINTRSLAQFAANFSVTGSSLGMKSLQFLSLSSLYQPFFNILFFPSIRSLCGRLTQASDIVASFSSCSHMLFCPESLLCCHMPSVRINGFTCTRRGHKAQHAVTH